MDYDIIPDSWIRDSVPCVYKGKPNRIIVPDVRPLFNMIDGDYIDPANIPQSMKRQIAKIWTKKLMDLN